MQSITAPLFAQYNRRNRPVAIDRDGDPIEIGQQLDRAITRYQNVAKRASRRLIGCGNSYIQGIGASVPAKSLAGLIAAAFPGIPLKNCGVNGGYTHQYVGAGVDGGTSLACYPLTASDMIFAMPGLNAVRQIGPDYDKFRAHSVVLQALLAWIGSTETQKVRSNDAAGGPNPGAVYTGAWNYTYTSPAQLANFASYSNTAGSSITYPATVPADVLYVIVGKSGFGDTLKITVEVDGVPMAVASEAGGYIGSNHMFQAVRIDGLDLKPHVVKCTASGSTSHMQFGVVAVDTGAQDRPVVLVGMPPDIPVAGWANAWTANSSTANTVTGGLVRLYDNGGLEMWRQEVRRVVAMLYRDGFNVVTLETPEPWMASAHVAVDNIHPNDDGYQLLSRPFLAAMAELFD